MSNRGPEAKPELCKGCPLFESTEGPVWGKGPKDAKIMFVGEAPGQEEGERLEPFVGGSGRVLSAQLAQAGIDRSSTFVTNLVKCRPTARGAGGRIVNRAPSDVEIRTCAKYLVGELQSVKPNVVVALGNVPMKAMTEAKKGISDVRSVPTEGPRRPDGLASRFKVIGTIHPAAIMRSQDYWPAVIFDLVRARNESAFPQIRRREWKRTIHASLHEHGPLLEKAIRDKGYYSHDLETTGLTPERDVYRCIGICADPNDVYCFDPTPQVLEFIYKLHADPTLMVIGQNSESFDIWFQEQKGAVFNGPTYDTMLGFHLLNSALPKDLGFIGACVTDEIYWKDSSMYKAGEDALQIGCCKDVHATGRAHEDQIKEMELLGQKDLYFNHIMPVQPVLRSMRRRGLKKDQRRAGGWHVTLNKKADELEARLKKGLGFDFNVNSPTQLQDLLYKRMGLPVQYKQTREGFRPTVDADALDALARVSNNPLLLLIRGIRTLRKWDSTFVMCPQDDNHFVHGVFSTAQAANGRLNCTDPNMQNFPILIREIMVPDSEDMVFVARDWSQIEWSIAMVLSGDRVGLDALVSGRDAHKDAYAQAFLKAYEEVNKAERDIAKAVNYGLLYGRGAESVSQGRAGHPEDFIPIDRVQEYMAAFLSRFSGYGKLRKHIEEHVKRHHYYPTPWGRRRWWYSTKNMPEAFNYPISGSAAHMMYEALVEMERELALIHKDATLRLSVHDELVLCVPKEQKILQQCIDASQDVMERAFPLMTEKSLFPDIVKHYYPNGWYCPSDCHIGETWRHTKGEDDLKSIEEELLKKLGVTTTRG